MKKWWQDLDSVLRGSATTPAGLENGDIPVSARGLLVVITILGMFYGLCMGCYGLLKVGGPNYWQMLATTIKVPMLFLLTLFITFPSLYVFNALVGSRLHAHSLLRLLMASLGVTLAVLSSLGPIVAFFSACTTSYHFMILLNVLVFSISGFLGLSFLLQTLQRLTIYNVAPSATEDENEAKFKGALDPTLRPIHFRVKTVFRCWLVVFSLVGMQMAWILRPFIGAPSRPFTWFRDRESNFFEAVFQSILALFS